MIKQQQPTLVNNNTHPSNDINLICCKKYIELLTNCVAASSREFFFTFQKNNFALFYSFLSFPPCLPSLLPPSSNFYSIKNIQKWLLKKLVGLSHGRLLPSPGRVLRSPLYRRASQCSPSQPRQPKPNRPKVLEISVQTEDTTCTFPDLCYRFFLGSDSTRCFCIVS